MVYYAPHFKMFTFSKQAYNELLDFSNLSKPHGQQKYDWQLTRLFCMWNCFIHIVIVILG